MEYRISGERLKAYADQARRLGKVDGYMTPGKIEQVLAGVTTELPAIHPLLVCVNGLPDVNADFGENELSIVFEAQVESIAALKELPYRLSGPKCDYNGVLLPGIPAETLAEYPYAWIRENSTNGVYQLLLSQTGFYFHAEDSVLEDNNARINLQYEFPMGETTETSWINVINMTYYRWTIDGTRVLLWSNQDIPNGAADAAEVYFAGSEAVPAE